MKSLTRFPFLLLAATAIAAVTAPARASDWLTSKLFSGQTSQISRQSASDAAKVDTQVQLVATGHNYRDGSFAGQVYDAYYGLVQVQVNIQGGRLVSVDVLQFPNHRSTSREINRQASPMLESEVISSQSFRVNMISGATLTSDAYIRSLYGALRQAGS